MRLFCITVVLCLTRICLGSAGVWIIDDSIAVEARINGQPVMLGFDTGSERTCLFRSTARRLGLKVTDPDPNAKADAGRVVVAMSEECEFAISHVTTRMKLAVYDEPEAISRGGLDGYLAWCDFRDHIFRISGPPISLATLPALPEDIASWTKWPISPLHKVLIIEVSKSEGHAELILIDTGSPSGVDLNSRRWQQWREAHKNAPTSPVAFFTPGSGLLVRDECWADKLNVAGFTVTDVPVMQGRPDEQYPVRLEAVIGLFGLMRFEVTIDGRQCCVYTRPAATPPPPYKHNRLGAVFAPKDLASQDLIGYVVEESPAYEAGIRSGDILLSIGTLDVTKWRTDPTVLPLTRFWEQPAGTKHNLTLMREGKRFECAVTLRDILGPRSSTSAPPAPTPPSSADDPNKR